MDLNLKDKAAIVTGGSRGLGRAICLGLAAEGARVAVHYYRDRRQEIDLVAEANELAAEIRRLYHVEALPVPGDVSHLADIQEMFDRAETVFGPIDILVNNAAIWPTAYVKDMTQEHWNTTLAVNLTGPFLTCREAVRRWLAAARARPDRQHRLASGLPWLDQRACRLCGRESGPGNLHRFPSPRGCRPGHQR